MNSVITPKNLVLPFAVGGVLLAIIIGTGGYVVVTDNKKSAVISENDQMANNSTIVPTTIIPTTVFQSPVISTLPYTTVPLTTTNIPTVKVTTPIQTTKVTTTTIVSKTTVPLTTTVPMVTTTPPSSTKYKNGTYSYSGSYVIFGHTEPLTVSMTINNDIVTSITVTPQGSGESLTYQQNFQSGVESPSTVVIGKSLDNAATISRVNGASVTTNYFKNTVVPNIETKAS